MTAHHASAIVLIVLSLPTAQAAPKQEDARAAIVRTIEQYSKGTDERDVQKVEATLHENGHHYIPGPEGVRIAPTAGYLEALGKGQIGGQKRSIEIVSIDLASEFAAEAKVKLTGPTAVFTLYVTLAKVSDGWRILSVLAVVLPL